MLRSAAAWLLLTWVALSTHAATLALECPKVMAHRPEPTAHTGWTIYSNDPLRLSGADLMYIVDSHLEATLNPDEVRALNDENQSELSVFRIFKHRAQAPFTLICQYGDHAHLARRLPAQVKECTVVRRKSFAEEGEVDVKCL